MRRLEVRFSEGALIHLAEIFDYVAEKTSPQKADAYLEQITVVCDRIGDAAEAGHPRYDLRAGLRSWAIPRRAVILYAIEDDHVMIAGIFHRGRSIDDYYRNATTILR